MPTREEMIAHGRSVDEVARELGADSLAYLSLEGVYEAVGSGARDALRRLLHRRVPARGHRAGQRQARARGAGRRPGLKGLDCRTAVGGALPDRRAGLRVRHEPPGDPRQRARARRHRGGRRRQQQARREGARAGASARASRRPSSRPPPTPDRAERDREMAAWLEETRGPSSWCWPASWSCSTPASSRAFPSRVINVHPALLPAFPGAHPVEDQIAYGVKVGGVTVHFVDEGVDSGPIILQEAVRLPTRRRARRRSGPSCTRPSTSCCRARSG